MFNIVSIILVVFFAYCNALLNGFVGDDNLLIVHNTFYKTWANFPRLFQDGYIFNWTKDLFTSWDYGPGSVSYRPASNATYFVDYWIWGLKPWGFHLTNVLFHVANVVLAYRLLIKIGLSAGVAFFAALLFGLHPIQSEAVCNIGYRADLMAAFFVLIAFHLWIDFRTKGGRGRYAGVLLSFLLAVFSKESAVTLPIIIFVYEWMFKNLRRISLIYQGGLWAIVGFYTYLYFFVFSNSALATNQLLGPDTAAHALGMAKIFIEYLNALVAPMTVRFIPTLYAPAVNQIFLDVLLPLILYLVAAVILCRYAASKLFIFLLLWFVVFYLPVSNLVPLANPMAFRFMYLPSLGFLAAAAILLDRMFSSVVLARITPRFAAILKSAVIIMCLLFTVIINRMWRSDFLIASMWVKSYPQSWKANEILGLLHFKKESYRKAEWYLLKSLQYGGRERDIRIDYYLGMCYLNLNQLERAQRHFAFVLTRFPNLANVNHGMGMLLDKQGKSDEALAYYQKAIDLFPSAAWYYLEPIVLNLKLDRQEAAKALLIKARQNVTEQGDLIRLDAFFDKAEKLVN